MRWALGHSGGIRKRAWPSFVCVNENQYKLWLGSVGDADGRLGAPVGAIMLQDPIPNTLHSSMPAWRG